jgi:DNA polymerase-3 subunit epsilon
MKRQIILDTETTGLSPEKGHRIIEIGCLEMINRRLTGSQLHFYLNPNRAIDVGAQEKHGLSVEFLSDKPVFGDIADELIEYLKSAELIIHNAPFDIRFIDSEFRLAKKSFFVMKHCTVIDTLLSARHKHPGKPNDLDSLCRRYQVNNEHREFHGALLDSHLLAQVYLAMTGGQEELFGEEGGGVKKTSMTQKIAVASSGVSQNRIHLPVIEDNAEELAAHENFLKEFKKKKNKTEIQKHKTFME